MNSFAFIDDFDELAKEEEEDRFRGDFIGDDDSIAPCTGLDDTNIVLKSGEHTKSIPPNNNALLLRSSNPCGALSIRY